MSTDPNVGFHADGVVHMYSVSNCINEDFADYVT